MNVCRLFQTSRSLFTVAFAKTDHTHLSTVAHQLLGKKTKLLLASQLELKNGLKADCVLTKQC